METKQVIVNRTKITLLKYNDIWVFPYVTVYQHGGLGSPIAVLLYEYCEKELLYYTDATVNLPNCSRGTGCQHIDTNNNNKGIVEWLVENQFGEPTGNTGISGFCSYPEFDFYKGEKFWEYKKLCEKFKF